ncbi:hypothetical protein HN51_005707 [Arachis hypogaea]|uniref:Uncharacterized protein n=2 Tax=Arachis TaxID=3817 RepID=A0A445DDK1_ARAHY|nr:uncharacterized protein LOC107485611 [Arachis duranensis]XP_025696080.1 uncharacterized protein LOC112797387 [Arachis hypogaea]RYR61250.1 hypothetical protein Ahy_A04g018394 [Arachis hypogaea]
MDDYDSSMAEHQHPSTQPPLPELIHSLEQATFMAKQLQSTTNPSHLLQIHTSLHHAHQNLSTFLSTLQFPPPPPPPPAAENSVSSANGAAGEPMQMGDDDGGGGNGDDGVVDAEETSKCTIEKVEEKMRDCFIKNKRAKRPLSPSAAAAIEEKRLSDEGFVGRVKDYDPHAMKLRALDLVYQFHG